VSGPVLVLGLMPAELPESDDPFSMALRAANAKGSISPAPV
jgi:hypothetical protein